MRSFAFRKAQEVEAENLRLRATKTVPAFDDGDGETPESPYVSKTKSKGKGQEKKGRDSSQLLRLIHDRQVGQC